MSWANVAGAAVSVVGGAINASNAKKSQPGAQTAAPTSMIDPTQYAANLNNVNAGMNNQQNVVNQLQAQNGLKNQSDVFNQLGNVAAGQGPNPAQAMLANATGSNTANQAALMASQRGSAANVGLLARQAANQGAMNQQNMAGQAAALQAQQSLGALGQQSNIAGQQANQLLQGSQQFTQAGLQGQKNLLDAQNAQNEAAIKNAQMVNLNNQTNAGRQANLEGNMSGAIGTAIAGPLGQGITGMFGNSTPTQGQTTMDNAANTGGTNIDWGSGGSQGESAPMESPGMFDVSQAAEGGMATKEGMQGPSSRVGKHFHGVAIPMAKGGKVPALVSPGERYLPPKAVKEVAKGKDPMKAGEKIPGKPKVKGAKNDYKNDTVPKTLEEGGIVLPRSVTQAKHPHWAAHQFVSAIMAKQGKGIK